MGEQKLSSECWVLGAVASAQVLCLKAALSYIGPVTTQCISDFVAIRRHAREPNHIRRRSQPDFLIRLDSRIEFSRLRKTPNRSDRLQRLHRTGKRELWPAFQPTSVLNWRRSRWTPRPPGRKNRPRPSFGRPGHPSPCAPTVPTGKTSVPGPKIAASRRFPPPTTHPSPGHHHPPSDLVQEGGN
jgi:hypothetical protein